MLLRELIWAWTVASTFSILQIETSGERGFSGGYFCGAQYCCRQSLPTKLLDR